MKTLTEVLEILDLNLDQATLEEYINRTWLVPASNQAPFYFEDIDIARIRLIHQLKHDMLIEDEAVDIVLSLLDQLYGIREQMRKLTQAIECQPRRIQAEIFSLITEKHDE